MRTILFICILSLMGCTVINDVILSEKSSDYFGQMLPGNQPEIFADGIVSGKSFSPYPVSFSADHKIMIFGGKEDEGRRGLFISYREGEQWSDPKAIQFTNGDEMEPIFSSDGKRLFFSSNHNTNLKKPNDIYYVDVLTMGFSEAIKLPSSINTGRTEYYASQSLNGTLYFTREGYGIFKSRFLDDHFHESERLEIDSNYYHVSHPFVSKDESYILFDAKHEESYGRADLYIAFRTDNGYSEPINLGQDINGSHWNAMPLLSHDEKYLFYVGESNGVRDVFWVAFDPDLYREKIK